MSTAVFQRQEDVKFATKISYISDIAVMSPDTLLLSNGTEHNVQLIDTRTGRVLSEVSLQRTPWRLCLSRSDQAAVAVAANIQMLNIQGHSLTKSTLLELQFPVFGIKKAWRHIVCSIIQ